MHPDPKVLEFRARLDAAQETVRRLRVAAFVDYAPVVCGLPLRPITLRSYTLLLAWRNAFVSGGPVGLKDIVQFVWLHSPAFGQFAHRARRRVARRVWWSLHPVLPAFNDALGIMSLLPRFRWLARFRRATAAERSAAAVADIRRLVQEALHDFPAGDEEADPLPFALAPQLVSLLVRGYPGALDFRGARELVDTLPLCQLVEFVREVLHRLSQGRDKLLTPDEVLVWRDYLAHQNAAPAAATSKPVAA